jgi:hypothetical protein
MRLAITMVYFWDLGFGFGGRGKVRGLDEGVSGERGDVAIG